MDARFVCLSGNSCGMMRAGEYASGLRDQKEGGSVSIHKTRGLLYKLARVLGDVSAATSGDPTKMTKRVGRRAVGKKTGRAIGKLFK